MSNSNPTANCSLQFQMIRFPFAIPQLNWHIFLTPSDFRRIFLGTQLTHQFCEFCTGLKITAAPLWFLSRCLCCNTTVFHSEFQLIIAQNFLTFSIGTFIFLVKNQRTVFPLAWRIFMKIFWKINWCSDLLTSVVHNWDLFWVFD